MSLVEFIGFIISFAAFVFLFFRRKLEEKRRREHPEQFEEQDKESEGALKDFLKSLEMDMEEIKEDQKRSLPLPPPPPKVVKERSKPLKEPTKRAVQDQFRYKTSIEDYKQKSAVEERLFKTDITNESFKFLDTPIVSEDLSLANQEAYAIVQTRTKPRLYSFVQLLPSRREMIISNEIIGRPKALRPYIGSQDYP